MQNDTIFCRIIYVSPSRIAYVQNGQIEENQKSEGKFIPREQVKEYNQGSASPENSRSMISNKQRMSTRDVSTSRSSEKEIYPQSKDKIEVRFGIKAGYNSSTMSGIKDVYDWYNKSGYGGYADVSVQYRGGVHIGIVSQLNFSTHFFLQPELLYSLQGEKEVEHTRNIKDITDLSYLQLPIYAGYKINVGLNTDIIAGLGPYFGYGIAGSNATFGNNGILKRFDYGISAMGGVQIKHVQLTIGYYFGLNDLIGISGWKTAKESLGLSSVCNRNIKFSAAYLF
jgi:hypothetical protein